jgi:uncharacterized membrane protein YhaH (DUF805 family)
MNTFFTKLAMLVMFLLAVTCGWAALVMVFPVSLFNILLGILAAFFLLRAFELADKINKLGPYSDEDDQENNKHDGGKVSSGSDNPDKE